MHGVVLMKYFCANWYAVLTMDMGIWNMGNGYGYGSWVYRTTSIAFGNCFIFWIYRIIIIITVTTDDAIHTGTNQLKNSVECLFLFLFIHVPISYLLSLCVYHISHRWNSFVCNWATFDWMSSVILLFIIGVIGAAILFRIKQIEMKHRKKKKRKKTIGYHTICP